jgi:hypothetical protein
MNGDQVSGAFWQVNSFSELITFIRLPAPDFQPRLVIDAAGGQIFAPQQCPDFKAQSAFRTCSEWRRCCGPQIRAPFIS